MILEHTLYMRNYRKIEKNRIKHLIETKEYYQKNKEKVKKYRKEWAQRNKYRQSKYNKNSREKSPEKAKVYRIANKEIKIPIGQICKNCNEKLAKIRHHEDYSKPLQVILCCKRCHGLLDEQRHIKEEKLECGN